MPQILAEELDTLTVEDIHEWGRRSGNTTDVIDTYNLTDERWARLKSLVRERNKPSETRAVDADELNAKLRQISPRRFPSPSDTASTASTPVTAGGETTEEEQIEFLRRMADEKYKELKDMGGRPSRAINPDPGPCPAYKSDVNKRYHVSDHWSREAGKFERELNRWLDFRWRQFKVRENSKVFNKYKEAIHAYQEKKEIGWVVELQLDRQTKSDEWKEYYIYEYRKRRALENKLDRAKKELEPAKEEMRKAERNGSVGVPEIAFSGRWRNLIEYDKKISRAQQEVNITQKRLNVLRFEKSLSDVKKDYMITRAEEDLESAQKRLKAEKSDELEQLSNGSAREHAQAVVASAQGKVNYAHTRLEQLDTLLEWIAGQFTEIATEYASSGWENQHNRDLLDGWEKYYAYMRERLQAAQDRVAEIVQEEAEGRMLKHERHLFQCEQGRVKHKEEEFKALWAWIKLEFPEIAVKYAPSGQDSQSNNDHQAILPYSKPSPNESAREAFRSNGGKSTQRKGRPARKQSPLSQVQPSKVSKPIQRRRHPLNGKLNATRHEGHANDAGQVKEQGPPEVAVRKSKRVSQRACDPAPTLVRVRESSSRCRPDGTLRRSTRILERTEKLHSLGSDQEAKPAPSRTTFRQKSPRRTTTIHTDTTYSGTPQGISKTRRWKTTSKKGKNV
ncbi:hypothetical protein AA0117_g13255 [Alternaria alternata]|uniref:Uncharacterized protein n=1 Tax=Alternaria alternata TaxID=5599 RepID=A0A4Q4MQG7_ALTAL|nr:hypothetical protein AA0117_g13255 [Alternaria alternata]